MTPKPTLPEAAISTLPNLTDTNHARTPIDGKGIHSHNGLPYTGFLVGTHLEVTEK